MMKIISTIFIVTVLSGCSLFPKPTKQVEVVTIQEEAPMYHPPLPIEMQMTKVEFEVLTPEIMQEYLQLVESGNAPPRPYYALTSQQYENLAMNMAEVRRYTMNILQIIKFYRDYDKSDDDKDTGQQ